MNAKLPFLVDVSHRAKLCAPDLGLLDIAERSGLPFSVTGRGADALIAHELLEPVESEAAHENVCATDVAGVRGQLQLYGSGGEV